MLTLIFRNKYKKKASASEESRLVLEAPVQIKITPEGNYFIDKNISNQQVSIQKAGENYFVTTDIESVNINDRDTVLTDSELKNLQTSLNEIEVFQENVLKEFKEEIPFKVNIDHEVKYIEEIKSCFKTLIDQHRLRLKIQKWLSKINNLKKEDFPEFKKAVMEDIDFEDYDRTNTQNEIHIALDRKSRYLSEKKIMFLDLLGIEIIPEDELQQTEKLLEGLEDKNKAIKNLKNKLKNINENKNEINNIETLDLLTKHFKKLLIEDRSNRTLSHGDYIHVANNEIEISNITDPEKSHQWNRPFDPDITYKEVDNILATVKNSDFINESKLNYIKQRYPGQYSKDERKSQEDELHDDIIKCLPVIRNLIRFDCKILKYEKGKIICRKGDFGNSAFFIVEGTVGIVLQSDEEKHKEKFQKQKVKKKNIFKVIAQLFTAHHHVSEYRSKARNVLTTSDPTIFVQDFDQLVKSKDLQFVTTQSAGNMFGEISAMGRTPRTATVLAMNDVTLLEIRWQGLRDLRENLPIFKEITDANFRERGLDAHIREAPLFRNRPLTDADRKELAKTCVFKSYGDFKWNMTYKDLAKKGELNDLSSEPIIISEGDFPDSIYLIRSGFARVSRRFNNGHLTKNYLGKGAHFGLEELKYNYENPHQPRNHKYSLRSIGYLDAIKVPKELAIKYIFEKDPECVKRHEENMKKVKAGLSIEPQSDKAFTYVSSENKSTQGLVESLVGNRIVNGTKTMLINMDRCTRCDDCVVACANAHDGNPRFIRHGHTFNNFMVANACMHCNDPVCMIGCPTGAINRNTDGGQVLINDSTCIGCSTCANSCPYDNIRMVEYMEQGSSSFKIDKDTGTPFNKATKCDLCIDQPGGPACQRACPHDALKRVDLSEISKVEKWLNLYKKPVQ